MRNWDDVLLDKFYEFVVKTFWSICACIGLIVVVLFLILIALYMCL